MPQFILQNKFAVIAGASQGIGADTARLFAAEGAEVIVIARDRVKLEAVGAEITRSGGKAHVYPMDVSVTENWRGLSAWMRKESLTCDILVNNAYWRTLEKVGEVTDEDWERTIGVSLKSYFIASREMIPFMQERKGGSIIHISSLQSHTPEPSFGAYAVAKGGVEALSRVIARDYGPSIRSNSLVSGAVDTPAFVEGEDFKKELGLRLPLGRIGQGPEIAQTALYLASSMSSFVTGIDIIADGGRSIT